MNDTLTRTKLLTYKKRLSFYNQFSFIGDVENEFLFDASVIEPFFKNLKNENIQVIKITIENFEHLFVIKKQTWDSDYFNLNCFSIELILFDHANHKILSEAIKLFIKSYAPLNSYYTINVPAEDLLLIQALGFADFILIETRLNYFLKLKEKNSSEYNDKIKIATESDIPILRAVAKKMRNRYDRVHADPAFSNEQADEYLAKFAEESVKGFAEIVLKVVDENENAFGFLAANYPIKINGISIAKLVLAAVDSSVQTGQLNDLLSEMINRLKIKRADYLTTITQAGNIPAIRVWEKAGFKLFKVTHLYSLKND